MTAKESFSKRLRELRGDTPIKDLAEKAGVALTALYNAEAEKPVSWKTIERAYGELCLGKEHFVHLLCLWALTQTGVPIGLYEALEMMTTCVRDEASRISKEDSEMAREMAGMTVPERRSFLEFAKHYREHPATQKMVAAWMEAVAR